MAIYKVFPTTDGRFAICSYTQVNSRIGIWSPINEKRFPSLLVAEFSMACIKDSIFEEKATPIQEKKPKKIVSNAGVKKLPRTYFRYTKLEKRVLLW